MAAAKTPDLTTDEKLTQQADTAAASLQREEKRLAGARAELELVARELAGADPDDAAAFERLVSKREATRARVDALEGRADAARSSVEAAKEAVAAAQREADERRLAELDAKARQLDDETKNEVREFAVRLAERVRLVKGLVDQANQLERSLGRELSPFRMYRTSYLAAGPGSAREALHHAAETVPSAL